MCIYISAFWLETVPFGEFLGVFLTHDVTHLSDRPWAETCRLRDSARPGRVTEKKCRITKSQKVLYFPYSGRSPRWRWADLIQKLHDGTGWPPPHNHVCQVSSWYLQRLRFYRGSNFWFSYLFLHGLYNSAAQCDACDNNTLIVVRGTVLNADAVQSIMHRKRSITAGIQTNTWFA